MGYFYPSLLVLTLEYYPSGGFRGGNKVMIEPHRHEGVFIARGKEDVLATRNMVVGESVYGEKRMSVEVRVGGAPGVIVTC